jgi:hypothetical protein
MLKTGEVYQHYKKRGTEEGYYVILSVGTDTETGEIRVAYKGKDGREWSRPYEMFTGSIEVNGETVPRFERINGDLK